jgi:lactate dehydrogenase-like 2-hydroxyacid dehydrogenase
MDEVLLLAPVPPGLRDALAARYSVLTEAPDPARILAAITTSVAGADAAALAKLPALRVLGCMGVGLDRIDLKEAARRGIVVRHTPDAVRTDTADSAVALLFAVVRRVVEADRFVRAGRWMQGRMPPSRRVSGMRAGVVGLGAIGAMVAQRLTGLGLDVAYTGPREKPATWRFEPDLAMLASWCDVLVLCCPGGDATRGLVSAEVLRRLGPAGYLINVARGSVVDEAALLRSLETAGIAGAGLDVFAEEPGLDPRFLPLERVVLTPHSAAVTLESREEVTATLLAAMAECFAR